jgi:hypothetical protein
LLKNFADVRARLVAAQTPAHGGATRFVEVCGRGKEQGATDATGRALLTGRRQCVHDGNLGRARLLDGA